MDTTVEPLFVPLSATRFAATDHTTGPWFPETQHGGAPAALLMRQIEAVETPGPMAVTRFTMELFGPVPVATLDVTTSIARPGRRIQYVTAEMRHDGTPIATASAWRIATGVDSGLAPTGAAPSVPAPDPDRFDDGPPGDGGNAFHRTAMQLNNVVGSFRTPGPGATWFRSLRPVVSDEEPSPAQRAAAVADFSNGVGSVATVATHLFVNTDLTLNLGRTPVGEWILLDAQTITGANGRGFSARLIDTVGQFGHATQSLLIAPR